MGMFAAFLSTNAVTTLRTAQRYRPDLVSPVVDVRQPEILCQRGLDKTFHKKLYTSNHYECKLKSSLSLVRQDTIELFAIISFLSSSKSICTGAFSK
jgi:hypothetical protein